jgi:hypothetical protein
VWPNPCNIGAHGRLHVSLVLDRGRGVELSLWDVHGRKVRDAGSEYLQSGRHMRSFSTAGLAAGLYLVRLGYRDGTQVRPFLVQ